MQKRLRILIGLILVLAVVTPAYANGEADLAAKADEAIKNAPNNVNFHVGADDVYMWIKMKKTDFQVVDVRMDKKDFDSGHIPGAINIPYNEIFKAENLKKIPKDKKIVVVCQMGATAGLTVVPLRMLGYDAYSMLTGMAGWIKDYPVAQYIQGMIDAPKTKNYPLEQTK
jgi:rhodanese-related sulfurtransferase